MKWLLRPMVVVAMALYFNGAFLVGTGGSNALAAENSSQLDLLRETLRAETQEKNHSVAMHFNSIAIWVGKAFTSTVVRQGCVAGLGKYSR